MKIVKKKIDDLISPEYNPRRISNQDYKKLKRSIIEFGFQDPLIVNKKNNHIVAGNQRFKVLQELNETGEYNYKEIDCVEVEMNENEEKAFNIAHNKIEGDFDENKLNDLFIELDMEGFDVTLTGFDVNLDVSEVATPYGVSEKTKPIGTDIEEIQVIVKCKTEDEQKELYLRLKEEGYNCQSLTL